MTTPMKKSVAFHDEYLASESVASTRAWARRMHGAQKDKNGRPYLEHLDAVAHGVWTLYVAGHLTDEELPSLLRVAYLHDIIEDTAVTAKDLEYEGYDDAEIKAIEAITKRTSEQNPDYIARVLRNRWASLVKYADLKHNTSPERMALQDAYTQRRLNTKYLASMYRIEQRHGLEITVTLADAVQPFLEWREGRVRDLIPHDLFRSKKGALVQYVSRIKKPAVGPVWIQTGHGVVMMSRESEIQYMGSLTKAARYLAMSEAEIRPHIAKALS